jgi:hypothetical protein
MTFAGNFGWLSMIGNYLKTPVDGCFGHKKSTRAECFYQFCGPDGTRTRDLRRDRAAF